MVRGYIKYDDSPVSLDQFRESTTRGYSIMTTPPFGSALIVVDADLAENPAERTPLPVAPFHPVRPPVGDPASIDQIAKLLVGAQNPLIVTSRFSRTPAGPELLVKLAESLEIPVIDTNDRVNMPTNHYLYQSFNRSLVGQADVVLALEAGDLFGVLGDVPDEIGRPTVIRVKPGTVVAEINSELLVGAGNYQDKQRFYPSDIPVAADAEATLPFLIDAVRTSPTRVASRIRSAPRTSSSSSSARARRRARRPRSAGTRARSPRRGCARNSGARSRTRTGPTSRSRRS
jgi:thiamine pyrophosphate-dependent acetolactate synthase large subunit-like protein